MQQETTSMSSKPTPGLQVRSRRAPSLPARPSKPSGPGVRWRFSPAFCVRFARDMSRIHTDGGNNRNLVQLRYRTSMRDRPSDLVLAVLLSYFATSTTPEQPQADSRLWVLQQ